METHKVMQAEQGNLNVKTRNTLESLKNLKMKMQFQVWPAVLVISCFYMPLRIKNKVKINMLYVKLHPDDRLHLAPIARCKRQHRQNVCLLAK